ncbi:MAG: UDP-N-acetylglucosamine 2-epimerase (non-hydrolyzing) [Candidatus Bathyarchaeota archaeon]
MGLVYTIKFNRYKGKRKNIHALKILKSNKHGHNNKGKTYSEKPFNDAKDLEIKEMEAIDSKSVVYDLSVEDTEKFVSAHGVVLHNTNTVLAGALAAVKLKIPVGHVEAGLRSYDRSMPEEINRILADHSSDFLFAPTEDSQKALLHEGIPEEKIFVTGNTVVDAVFQNLEISKGRHEILDELGISDRDYFLVTIHRQENVDCEDRLRNIAQGLERVQKEFGVDLIYPIHPRARKSLGYFGVKFNGVRLVEPLDYLSFLYLESKARLVLTDSGGVQEETCIMKVPCVTLRDNTERPETLEVGSNILAGTSPRRILEKTKLMLKASNGWKNPFGDGKASKKIVKILRWKLD